MTTETWLGLLILAAVIIVIWEILKGVYKKIRRKLYIRKISGKKKGGYGDYAPPAEPPPVMPKEQIYQQPDMYSYPKLPPEYNNQ